MENIITNVLGMDGKRRYRYFASTLLATFAISPTVLTLAFYLPSNFAELNPISLLILIVALTTPIVFLLLLSIHELLKFIRWVPDKNTSSTILSFFFAGFLGVGMLITAYLNSWTLEKFVVVELWLLASVTALGTGLLVLNLFDMTLPRRK